MRKRLYPDPNFEAIQFDNSREFRNYRNKNRKIGKISSVLAKTNWDKYDTEEFMEKKNKIDYNKAEFLNIEGLKKFDKNEEIIKEIDKKQFARKPISKIP